MNEVTNKGVEITKAFEFIYGLKVVDDLRTGTIQTKDDAGDIHYSKNTIDSLEQGLLTQVSDELLNSAYDLVSKIIIKNSTPQYQRIITILSNCKAKREKPKGNKILSGERIRDEITLKVYYRHYQDLANGTIKAEPELIKLSFQTLTQMYDEYCKLYPDTYAQNPILHIKQYFENGNIVSEDNQEPVDTFIAEAKTFFKKADKMFEELSNGN